MRSTGKYIHILLSMFVMLRLYPCGPQASTGAPAAATAQSFFERSASAASYSEGTHTWTLFAKVIQVKDVSIYGRPGSIAQVEYMNNGKSQRAWAAVRMEDYFFSDGNFPLAEGSKIILQVSGSYVSSKGVDWTACPGADLYCQNASFIEGGFPVSEDFGGLTMSPSNLLIRWGSVTTNDWVNGILAWKIRQLQIERLNEFLKDQEPKRGSDGKEIQSNAVDNETVKMPTSHGVLQGYNAQALQGKQFYARRLAIVEPVFANICVHKHMNRFTLRTKSKVDVQ